MPKIHFTSKYIYHNNGNIRAISACGLLSGIAVKNFIDCTIVETRVNCKNCLRVMNAAKKLQQPLVIKSACNIKPKCKRWNSLFNRCKDLIIKTMDLNDFLNMEDESSQRWEDSMKEHHCPQCDSIMEEKQSGQYGKYYRCNKCAKNYQVVTS